MKACIPKAIVENLKIQLSKGEIDANTIAKMLPEEKVALKSILESVVSEGLGVKVSSEEIASISKISKKIDTAQKTLGDDLGNPSKLQENIDFFKAHKEMDNYLQSRSPAPVLKVLTSTIGRGMMLFSVKSPVLNIGSNVEIGLTEALSRRIAGFQILGTDSKLARSYIRMVNKIYQKSGYDISRMETLRDTGASGERVLGHIVTAQGKGKVRAVGRAVEDVVFKQLMGAPDVAFSSAHFADSVNLNARKLAKGDKTLARTWMEDSMRINPTTPQGEILRTQGRLDAMKATWTDTSWASKVSNGIRNILNEVSGDLRAGDYLLPFIKTPANVIATGMEYAGLGIPKAFFKLANAVRTGELGSPGTMRSISRDLTRAGFGITGGLLITSQLKDDDFVGAYDPARAQIEALRNSNYNAIRIKGKWISTDWLAALAVPVTAIMYARKYGKTGGERTFQYSKGVLQSALQIPGVSDIYDAVKTDAYKTNQSLEEMTGETVNYISSQIYSRLIPSFLSDAAKAFDPKVRQSVKGFESIKSKIPGLSQTLPVKKNIFGEEVQGESALSDIFFGARIKTDKTDPLIKEVNTISQTTGKGISFTDWDRSSSKQLAQFKEQNGAGEFNKAKIDYGKELKSLLDELISSSDYEDMTDEDKLNAIRNQDTKAIQTIFDDYGFEYEKPTKD
jgi:hypothetical protein